MRERDDLRLLEAVSVPDAVGVAEASSPDLLIVDDSVSDVRLALPHLRALVLVDDVPHGASASGPRVRFLARPFSADELLREVGALLDATAR